MNDNKCKRCKWRIIMSFTDGKVVRTNDVMCHYNWKRIEKVRPEECHFKEKREEG